MKYIKLFENFNKSIYDLEEGSVELELARFGIENYTINSDGTIDVDGNVNFNRFGRKTNDGQKIDPLPLSKIPFIFGKVTGNFICCNNNLTSLEGSPYYVGGDFNCSSNKLKDLKGSPDEVGGMFIAANNSLESVYGITLEIGESLYLNSNKNLEELNCLSNIEGMIFVDKHVRVDKFSGYCKKVILVD